MSDDDEPVNTLALSGPVTLYVSGEIREVLLAALADEKPLRLDLETSGPWDLAGLQMLIATVAAGLKIDRAVRFVHVPRACAEIAECSGLGDWLNDHSDSFL